MKVNVKLSVYGIANTSTTLTEVDKELPKAAALNEKVQKYFDSTVEELPVMPASGMLINIDDFLPEDLLKEKESVMALGLKVASTMKIHNVIINKDYLTVTIN